MKKILVVGNLKYIFGTGNNILERDGIRILAASSGEDALNVQKSKNAGLIITALELPGMGGDRLCTLVRMDPELKRVSTILICSPSASDIERADKCRANAYMTRPVRQLQLLEKVAQLLNISQRKDFRALMKVSVDGRSNDGSFYCSTRDISATGILLHTDRIFEVGEVVACAFFLPNSIRVFVDAEIVRFKKNFDKTFLYGARFVRLNNETRAAIELFINSRSGMRNVAGATSALTHPQAPPL